MKVKNAPVGLFQLDDGEVICISEYSSGNDSLGYSRDAIIVSSGENYWGGDDREGSPINISQLQKAQQDLEKARKTIEFYADKADVFDGYDNEDDYSQVCSGNLCVEVLGKRARETYKNIWGDKDE